MCYSVGLPYTITPFPAIQAGKVTYALRTSLRALRGFQNVREWTGMAIYGHFRAFLSFWKALSSAFWGPETPEPPCDP